MTAASPAPTAPRGGRLGTFLLSLLALVWVAAYTPDPWVVATVPGIVALLLVIERCRRVRDLVLLIALFGAVAIGYGYRWLAPTVQEFSNGLVGPVGSWGLVALFGAVGTVHVMVFGLLYRRLVRRARRPHPLVTVALFVACESLPIRLFPWMVGHGAINCPPLLQSASWGGVPGVSFALLALVVPVHELLVGLGPRPARPARLGAAGVTFLVGAALFAWGHLRWDALRTEDAAAVRHLSVGIVQPDIGARDKRRAEQGQGDQRRATLEAYERGSRAAIAAGAELVVWPETAITDAIRLLEPRFEAAVTRNMLARHGWGFLEALGKEASFLVGAYEQIPTPAGVELAGGPTSLGGYREKPDDRYNVAALRPRGAGDGTWSVYRKTWLIPFGEAMPLGLPQSMLPQGFVMRPAPQPSGALVLEGLRLVPFLCYEGILAGHVRATVGEQAPDLLVSLTNDSWFGDSWEPHQHLNFTRFRAVEHAAPLVRATNTGISAFVTAGGDIVDRRELGEEGILVRRVPLVARGPTLYARHGHRLPWVLGGLALLVLVFGPLLPAPRPAPDA
jgi:apolipoprotein N-acyltransferase